MADIIKKFSLLVVLLILGAPMEAQATWISSVEFKLMDRINQERQEALSLNSKLCRVAQSRSKRFYADRFGSETMDESGDALSLESSGYLAKKDGASEIMIMFSNYLSSQEAAKILLGSLKNQMKTQFDDESNLFSPQMVEIGIDIIEAPVLVGGARFNVYVGSVVWAEPLHGLGDVDQVEAEVLNLINQERCLVSLPPVYPEVQAVSEGDVLLSFSATGDTPEDLASKIFDLAKESGFVFGAQFSAADVSVTIDIAKSEEGYQMECNADLIMSEAEILGSRIFGIVYEDLNFNGHYDPGEGIGNTPMVIYDAGIHSRTGIAGEINEVVSTPGKGYQVVLFAGENGTIIRNIQQANQTFILIDINNNQDQL